MTVIRREPRNGQAVNNASIRRISARSSSSFAGAGRYTPERAIPSRRHCPRIEISGWPRSSIALRSEVLIARTSALKKSSPPSTARSWRAASRSPVRAPRPRRCRRRGRRPAPRSPAAASSRHKSGSDEPRDAPPGPPPSPAPAAPPGRSSPSAPHRSSVSASSSSSPSTTTEPTPLQSSRWSQNRGPLHRCGQPISPTSRSAAASSTWSRSSTGQAGRCWPGGCRTRWMSRSASTRSTRAGALRPARDFQYRPGLAVHQRRLHRPARGCRHPDLHGRPRPLDGQRVHRTAVAVAEVRGRLSEGLRRRPRSARRDRRVDRLLQWPTAASSAGRPNPDGGVARGRQRRSGRQRRGHDASLGRRCRVAHMPTATTTATDALRGVIKEVGAGQLSNQERWSGGPAEGVHFSDKGNQYRSAIFVANNEQKELAEASKRKLEERFGRPIATDILAAGPFYHAEEYHQDYYKKSAALSVLPA